MYSELYRKPQMVKTVGRECLQKKRNTVNLTGIPMQTKQRFEQMSGYSFDDVRVHYSSDKPAQFGAFAYTQGNEIHIAPGQERHLEHELVHVVQQKEGRVKPTSYIGNTPVNDDAALEREADAGWSRMLWADMRWGLMRTPEPGQADRAAVPAQGVLQGNFVNVSFQRSVYEKQLLKLWRFFLERDTENRLGAYKDTPAEELYDVLTAGGAYSIVREIVQNDSRMFARLDILIDLIKHYENEIQGEPYEQSFTHYHMYSSDTQLEEGEDVGGDADLFSAVDSQNPVSIKMPGFEIEDVFWIESFVSFQRGAGMKLLQNILSDNSMEKVRYVALGAYAGSEDYYQNVLGMARAENVFVTEGDREFIDEQGAIEMLLSTDMTEEGKAQTIQRGIEQGFFYPVYYARKEDIQEQIREKMK